MKHCVYCVTCFLGSITLEVSLMIMAMACYRFNAYILWVSLYMVM